MVFRGRLHSARQVSEPALHQGEPQVALTSCRSTLRTRTAGFGLLAILCLERRPAEAFSGSRGGVAPVGRNEELAGIANRPPIRPEPDERAGPFTRTGAAVREQP